MRIEPLSIDGAFVVTPRQFPDDRGVFLESFRGDRLAEHLGYRPDVVQTNVSVSARGTVRGIHFADVPPGQGKYVTALSGTLLDYVVDVRVGSPTFVWTADEIGDDIHMRTTAREILADFPRGSMRSSPAWAPAVTSPAVRACSRSVAGAQGVRRRAFGSRR